VIATALLSLALAAGAPRSSGTAQEGGLPAAGPKVESAGAPDAGCGLPPLAGGARPWRTGETLTFDLELLGVVKTGTMQLSVDRPMSGGKIVPLRARARTTSAIANLKRFTAVGLSWIEVGTLLPERYRDEADENGVRKMSDARILPAGSRLVIEHQFGERTGRTAHPRSGPVLDPLSTLAYLRAARLEPGARYCFDLVANRRFWRVEATVAADAEKVETPAGRFDTVRVDATARRADRPGDRPRPVHLWLSRDPRRLLVAVVSEVDLGPVRASLSEVRGAR
jgi:hypothetical protein